MRGLVRVFLRGTVVRAADFAGSGFLMLIRGAIEPRMLSIVATPLCLIWIFTTFRMKQKYSNLLLKTLVEEQIDWKRLEDMNFSGLAQG